MLSNKHDPPTPDECCALSYKDERSKHKVQVHIQCKYTDTDTDKPNDLIQG